VGVETWIDWDAIGANVLAWLITYALHSTVLIGGAWVVAVVLARLACRRQLSEVDLHRAPVLRDQLRHRCGDSHHRAVAGFRARLEQSRYGGP
jgi:hypothetical protein